jgi:outer membrane lipoprotein SlyB
LVRPALALSARLRTVYHGTVMSVREVTIKRDSSMIGTATGAVLGGLAGSELGGGDKAQTAGAIGGAVLGGIAGNEAGKAVGTSKAFAYIVRFSSGESKEIIQGADVYIAPGTPVDIIASAGWLEADSGGGVLSATPFNRKQIRNAGRLVCPAFPI